MTTPTPTPHLTHPKYRPDIDGLRAVAVLSVVVFHAFPSGLKGGFTGVDVFFVISGYLISTIIFENLDRGTFSFSEFYARRVKRIFPALVVVLAFCLILGWLCLLPEELNQLGKHVVAGAGFVSNLVLWSEAGYFDNSAETKPLLHLWSLGIEEQFYIAWPLLLWLACKRRINLFLVTAALLLGSFALNIWLVNQDPIATFYSPLTRFWELLCGALLALYSLHKAGHPADGGHDAKVMDGRLSQGMTPSGHRLLPADGMSFVGLATLVSGFLFINKELSFPGYWALMPVAGTVLIILAGPAAWVNRRILSSKLLVWFGLISFPLYLWHWPLLSFGRIVHFDTPSPRYRIIAVLTAIGLAWLTMRFIERPLRFGDRRSMQKVFGLSGALVALALAGAVILGTDFRESHSFDKLSIKRKGEHAIGSSLAWFQGKEDWLFLGNTYDNTVAKLKLATTPTEEQVHRTVEGFSRVSEAGARFGARTFLIVGPDKPSVYPEYLPDGLVASPRKYSGFFLDRLRSIPGLAVYDPTADLLAAKSAGRILYWKTDTHWNHLGAYLVYSGFANRLDVPTADVTFRRSSGYRGDLIDIAKLKNFPLSSQDHWDVVWKEAPAWRAQEIQDEQKTSFGTATLIINDKPLSSLHVWVVGDSFAEGLKQYFNATFREVRYVGHWSQKLDTLPAEIEKADGKPDLIVIVKVERSF